MKPFNDFSQTGLVFGDALLNMTKTVLHDTAKISKSFLSKLNCSISNGLPHAEPIHAYKTDEKDLVKGVLHMLQGFSSSIFFWDQHEERFQLKSEIYVLHLSQSSLNGIMDQFAFGGSCLKKVENFVKKVDMSKQKAPTLRAFNNSVRSWLKRLRNIALNEEVNFVRLDAANSITLLGLNNSLSSILSGAELLLQVVQGACPSVYFDLEPSLCPSEIATHVLDHLFKKLNKVCLVQGGEEEAYHLLLAVFTESLLPYIEGLDSWLYDGILDDPYDEMFFYSNTNVSVDQPSFWETSYLPRQFTKQANKLQVVKDSKEKDTNEMDVINCPVFLMEMSKAIISAGKSLQLIQHVQGDSVYDLKQNLSCKHSEEAESISHYGETKHAREMGILTLSEVYLLSLVGLVGDGDHIYERISDCSYGSPIDDKTWFKFLTNAISEKQKTVNGNDSIGSFSPRNPVITVCKEFLQKNKVTWDDLNISRNFSLPPLNDEGLRTAVFGETSNESDNRIPISELSRTDYTLGFQYDDFECLRKESDSKTLETLFPFPTLLPCFQEDFLMSELLPFQRSSTLASRILRWIQSIDSIDMLQPAVLINECLATYVKKQVDHIGKHVLRKLMNEWKLMDELGVLRAIYLLGSGDLLQQFLTVLYDKMDRGDSWGDDFELNTLLQESIRYSADGTLLSTPDRLVVSITKADDDDFEEIRTNKVTVSTKSKGLGQSFGIDAFDMLHFSYKVSWPLDLIANAEALKKYNQVMAFLLKVKHAKFVLDKTRRWMWKGRKDAKYNYKHHLVVQQKLLHFVDAFHQYVMDRVYHSAWSELCMGMASACSLDEVIEVHDAYLLSIQRQCFVAPDKLWALIASRVKNIIGLVLDFYSIEKTLGSGGTTPAIRARCESEMERIEKQFDDCIAFLLRILSFKLNIGHFPHLADLVTRINYNHFYMSDNGNLITVPRFEANTASRLVKNVTSKVSE